jgi:hypothetical protein
MSIATDYGKRPHGRIGLLAECFACLAGDMRVVGEWVKGPRINADFFVGCWVLRGLAGERRMISERAVPNLCNL